MSRTDNASDGGPGSKLTLGPKTDPAFIALGSSSIQQRVLLAHWVAATQEGVQRYLGMPLGKAVLRWWLKDMPGASLIERQGLPRHSLEKYLGAEALTLHINPRTLLDGVRFPPRKEKKRPSSMAFIWDGDWDLLREPIMQSSHYQFIRDLDENRHQLEQTKRYRDWMTLIERGKPWSSHQKGILLDTPEKIKTFLNIYIGYMDDMAANGYKAALGFDELDVVISREGHVLKISRGLHRLSIAVHVGVPSVPVRVCAVHRLWWKRVIGDAKGAEAMRRLQEAIQACAPDGVASSGAPLRSVAG